MLSCLEACALWPPGGGQANSHYVLAHERGDARYLMRAMRPRGHEETKTHRDMPRTVLSWRRPRESQPTGRPSPLSAPTERIACRFEHGKESQYVACARQPAKPRDFVSAARGT
jgi:hypothetical protein